MSLVYRGYIVKANPLSPSLLIIATEGRGGKIPAVLSGSFTSYGVAKRDIDVYLDIQKGKGNGKTSTEGGD